MIHKSRVLNALVAAVMIASALFAAGVPRPAVALSNGVVISQVDGGGGGSTGTYLNDYVELFNRGSAAVDLTGWSLQYGSSSGQFNSTGTNLYAFAASTTIQPGHYLLVQLGTAGTAGAPLPVTPDFVTTNLNLSGSSGKVALASIPTTLGCGATATPCPLPNANIVDLVSYGASNNGEGGTTVNNGGAITSSQGAVRKGSGCIETDNNNLDFDVVTAPTPRNSATAAFTCPLSTSPSGAGAASPAAVLAGQTTLLTVSVTPGTNPASTGLAVTADLSSIGGSATQAFFDNGTNGDVTGSDNVFSFQYTLPTPLTAAVYSLPASITDAQARSGSATIGLTVLPPLTKIDVIQGGTHISPLIATPFVATSGIVTGLKSNGFWLQDPIPDANPATSEGIFVFTSSAPAVVAGDAVTVSGTVKEFRPGAGALTMTELDNPGRTVTVTSHGNSLPAAVVLGAGGRAIPSVAIKDPQPVGCDVETTCTFDPTVNGLDFFESLESMRVQVNNAIVVGPTSNFTSNREIPVVADNGANIAPGLLTPRGGVVIQPGNFNPERIILNDSVTGGPFLPLNANVGDSFPGVITGIVDYNFGNFKLQVPTPANLPAIVHGGLQREVVPAVTHNQFTMGTFNVENLAPTDPPSKFSTLASLIINNMRSPDLLAIEEIQDNSGAADTGVAAADVTWGMLISAIQAAGGPTYVYRQIDPVNNLDGGAPGANIRQGFLFRTDRGLAFVERPGGDSTTPTAVQADPVTGKPFLTLSPGRIDPTNAAFTASRKPLAGEFTINGRRLFVIANHFNSKGGDGYLFGSIQPPVFSSETQRMQQATIVRDFVQSILALDANADVAVVGDLNDFQFSNPLGVLKGAPLVDLVETLPPNQRYTYVYQGNSEVLDHIMFSMNLTSAPFQFQYDSVQVNSEFWDQASDHDPQLARLFIQDAPVVNEDIPNQRVLLGTSWNFTFDDDTFIDPNASLGDTLSYTASLANGVDLPAWIHFNPATRSFTATPGVGVPLGVYQLKVTATDLNGAKVSAYFTLVVQKIAAYVPVIFTDVIR